MSDDRPRNVEQEIDKAALAAWQVYQPDERFADRVLAARREAAGIGSPYRRRRLGWRITGLLASVALVAVAALALDGLSPETGEPARGSRTSVAREHISIGDRAVAVAEPGSSLSWTVASHGGTYVQQSKGNVFYKVDPGGPFVVRTPAGKVTVAGTCFRVEVLEMQMTRQRLEGAAIGAAVGAAIAVGVYEGRVRLKVGTQPDVQVAAGEEAITGPAEGSWPSRTAVRSHPLPATARPTPPNFAPAQGPGSEPEAIPGSEVAAVVTPSKGPPPGKFFGFTKQELLDMARECRVRFDLPRFGPEPPMLNDARARELGLSPGELEVYNRAVALANRKFGHEVRRLHAEMTGQPELSGRLDVGALMEEIGSKAIPEDLAAARKAISEERAGLAPSDPARPGPVIERFLRLAVGIGDELMSAVARELGPERAAYIRRSNRGAFNDMAGCKYD